MCLNHPTAATLAVELGRRHTPVTFSAVAWAQHADILNCIYANQALVCPGALQGHRPFTQWEYL